MRVCGARCTAGTARLVLASFFSTASASESPASPALFPHLKHHNPTRVLYSPFAKDECPNLLICCNSLCMTGNDEAQHEGLGRLTKRAKAHGTPPFTVCCLAHLNVSELTESWLRALDAVATSNAAHTISIKMANSWCLKRHHEVDRDIASSIQLVHFCLVLIGFPSV